MAEICNSGGKIDWDRYVERMFEEKEKRMEDKFGALQIALDLATRNLAIKLDHMNALREEIPRRDALFLTRAEYLTAHQNLVEKMGTLQSWQNKLMGIGIVIASLAGIAGAIIAHVFFK